jgi:hypothetical protein
MPLRLVQLPPPPQPPPPQLPPPQPPLPPPQPPLPPPPPPAAAARPRPDAPPARQASRRRSREARSVRTTIRIISQITPGTITMTPTIIRMLVTTHPLANRCRPLSAPLPGRFRAPTPMDTSSWVLFSRRLSSSSGTCFLAVHHCSSRAVGGGFYASTCAGRAGADHGRQVDHPPT